MGGCGCLEGRSKADEVDAVLCVVGGSVRRCVSRWKTDGRMVVG